MHFYTKEYFPNCRCQICDYIYGKTDICDQITMYPFSAFFDSWPEVTGTVGDTYSKGDVVIGNDVCVSNGVKLFSAISVDYSFIIAERLLVTKDFLPSAIVAGNPLIIDKYRLKKKISKKLQKVFK